MDSLGNADPNQTSAKAGNQEPADGSAHSTTSLPPTSPQTPQPAATQTPPGSSADKWWKDRKFVLELLGFAVLFAYTWFACLQWLQIRWTNRLTREALDGSGYTLQETLKKMQGQINEAQKANLLTRESLEGEEGAVLVFDGGALTTSEANFETYGITGGFSNIGKVNARNVNAIITFSKVGLPNFRQIGRSMSVIEKRDIFPPHVPGTGSDGVIVARTDNRFTGEDLKEVISGREAFKIETSFTYDNGFGTMVKGGKCLMIANIYDAFDRTTLGNQASLCSVTEPLIKQKLKQIQDRKQSH